MKFRKMHGIGNDFVFVRVESDDELERMQRCSKAICDRNFGVGADGLIVLSPSSVADVKMTLFNSDGSIARMCGNAVRCIGRIISEERGDDRPVTIETLGGIKTVWIAEKGEGAWKVRVDMGEPVLKASAIPVVGHGDGEVIDAAFDIDGKEMMFTCVSMGNPHAVTFVDDLDRDEMMRLGPVVENCKDFPDRTNVEFVKIDEKGLNVLVWERGAGPTLACGTGACAVLVAACKSGRCGRKAAVNLPGGSLYIEWGDDNRVYMTGPAEHVFYGEISEIAGIDL